jgi:hypothetical protein
MTPHQKYCDHAMYCIVALLYVYSSRVRDSAQVVAVARIALEHSCNEVLYDQSYSNTHCGSHEKPLSGDGRLPLSSVKHCVKPLCISATLACSAANVTITPFGSPATVSDIKHIAQGTNSMSTGRI